MRLPKTFTDEWFVDDLTPDTSGTLDEPSVSEFRSSTRSSSGPWVMGAAALALVGIIGIFGAGESSAEEAKPEEEPVMTMKTYEELAAKEIADFERAALDDQAPLERAASPEGETRLIAEVSIRPIEP
jgi:hypothetical protein